MDEKSSRNPVTGAALVADGGGCVNEVGDGVFWKRRLSPLDVVDEGAGATVLALFARTSGRERMCNRQSSSLHLASRACTPLDTEHALR